MSTLVVYPDVTGWCSRGECGKCHGELRTATGYHWWCACICHPDPRRADAPGADPKDADRAIETWRKSREARS